MVSTNCGSISENGSIADKQIQEAFFIYLYWLAIITTTTTTTTTTTN
jgi:hypothetical protein